MATLIDEGQVEQPKISLEPQTEEPVGNPTATVDEIEKVDYALGADSPGQDSINAYIQTGSMSQLRQQTLSQQLLADRKLRRDYIAEASRRAAMEGRDLTTEEYQTIQQVSIEELTASEDTIFERMYAERLAREALVESEPVQQPEDVEKADDIKFTAEDYMTKQEIVKRYLSSLTTIYNQNGLLSNVWDIGRGFIPLYSALSQTGNESGVNMDATGGRIFNPGGTKTAEYEAMFFLPPEEFEQALKTKIDDIRGNSTLEALIWAQGLLDYTGTQAFLDTAFNAVDLAGLSAPVLAKTLKTAKNLAKVNKIPLNKTSRLVVTGNTREAARQQAFETLKNKTGSTAQVGTVTGIPKPKKDVENIMRAGPGILDPEAPLRDPGTLSNEATRRLLDGLSQDTGTLLSTLDDVTNLTRINENAFIQAVHKTEQKFRRQYTKQEDGILDITPVRESEEAFGGVDHILVRFGTREALPFKTEDQATRWAKDIYRFPDGGYEITQDAGNNWFINIRKNVDETDPTVQDLRVATNNRNPETLLNSFIGFLRTPDDLLSAEHTAARKQAVYGSNAILHRLAAVARSIGTLPKQDLKDLNTILDEARFKWRTVQTDEGVTRVQGKFYETAADLQSAYMQRFKRLPSEQETRAYFAFKNISDFDHIFTNISVLRDKSRLGLEQVQFGVSVKGASGGPVYKYTNFLEGKIIDNLPDASSGTYGVAWVSPKNGKIRFNLSDNLTSKMNPIDRTMKEELDAALASGDYKIIHVFNPNDEVLRGLNVGKGEPVNYLVVKDVKTKPLSTNQVPYAEDGRWSTPSNSFYVKQAIVSNKSAYGRRHYLGDKAAFSFQVPALAKKFGEAMEQGRRMIIANVPRSELDDFVAKNLPFADGEEFVKQFRSASNKDGVFDVNSPFVVTQTGQRVVDVKSLDDLFTDKVVVSNPAHDLSPKVKDVFTPEQLAQTIVEENAHFRIDTAQTLDPTHSLLRSISSLSANRFFDDYKHIAVENWAKQFADAIDAPKGEVMANPMKFLIDPKIKWKTGVDSVHVAAAKNMRRSILQFIGTDTREHRLWKSIRQNIVDGIYNVSGSKGVKILEPRLWNKETDAVTLARSAVFQTKLGLFNYLQFFQQSAGTLQAIAIDGNPRRAAQATFAYWAMRMQGFAPEGGHWGGVSAKIAKALGLEPDVLDDMYTQYVKSGMNIVEGEYGLLDDYLDANKIFRGKTGKALDAGTVFFKEGNNVHRGTSFALSYLKWREANPLAKVTSQDLQRIVDRADLLYNNMSRASNSALQDPNSLTSVPMQFFGFHQRMTEELLGKRLTGMEKARLFTAYSLVYGIPAGVGGTALGVFWPVNESIREYMLDHGIDADANVITSLLSRGLASILIETLTGEQYDVVSRFGPGGLTFFKDLFEGKLLETMGAGPNFVSDIWSSLSPFAHATINIFNPNPDYAYNLKAEDFIDVLLNVSTLNNATRAYMIWNTGQWVSKSQGVVGNVKNDLVNVAAIALGLTPQDIQDAYLMLDSNKKVQDAKNAIMREARVEARRGLKAARDGNIDEMNARYDRARWLLISGGFDSEEASQALMRFLTENESLIRQVGEDFMQNDPEVRHKNYRRQQLEQLQYGTD